MRAMSQTPPLVFDRALSRRRLARAAHLGPETFLLDRVAEDLADRLGSVKRRFSTALDLGTPTDGLARALDGHPAVERLFAAAPLAAGLGIRRDAVVADEEALPFAPQSLDLVVSALALQGVNDLPGVFAQVRRALKPDGLFLAGFVGGSSLTELRQAFAIAESETTGGVSPRVAPFADVRDLGGLLQRAGFALPVADTDRIVVRYGSPFTLFSELRRMGAANALTERRRVPLRRDTLLKAAEIYGARFADPDGRLRVTFDIVWLSGWAPHESQQKPLAPGSAKMSLAAALGAKRAGEPPADGAA
ncbi:methyltransferase domain-containing protein [Xanthobacter agilis]|uniref:SAM-dependent methyltransferase n=1 Tax=Xanthobacter agilis TaxID=47492 RepID=A0ABU0LEF0_XANAG|nr:methyltransferase domain-containing protein [Xanthobacter agilis]MDQ0505519.1 SAM-dependent methyltransferase [Xanthobacter agilis]